MDRISTLTVHAAALSFLLPLAGCLFPAGSGHENFKKIMQSQVGKSANDPYIDRNHYRSRRVAVKELPNGNLEEQYDLIHNCPVFFEIDKAAERIVGWRYEGGAQDCIVVP